MKAVSKLTETQKRVLSLTRRIPRGRVSTYKEIARKLRVHPRAVARALTKNPFPIKIPCHRVIHADGKIGGYTPRGMKEKIRLLKKEGIKIRKGRVSRDYFYFLTPKIIMSFDKEI